MISPIRPRKPIRPLNHRDAILLIVVLFFAVGSVRAEPDPADPGIGVLMVGDAAAPALRTEVDIEVVGMIAEVVVNQEFVNPGADWVEGIYAFPLPENAAVNEMELEVDGRRIVGQIQEKTRARKTYETARAQGKRAGLVTQKRPNLFTTRVANIPPGEAVAVRIRYIQTLDYASGRFSLRFPMTITPRYGEQRVELDGLAQERGGAAGPVVLTASLRPGFELVRLESLHHDAVIEERGGVYAIRLAEDGVAADRDFELIWEPSLKQVPQAALFAQEFDGEPYALLMMLPPQPEFRSLKPRELILVIDTSGSMQGASLAQAQESLLMALGSLNETDRFNLIEFNSTARALFPEPVDATDAAVGRAVTRVQQLEANGGTEMAPALQLALKGDPPAGFVRQVVFITDGAVGNESALFAAIERELREARLFTVGIGSAPNSYFMRKAAEFGRGSFTYVADLDEVAEKMDMLLSRLEYPVLTDVCVAWPGNAEMYPRQLPDLYLGEPLVVAARLDQLSGKAQVCGEMEQGLWDEALALKVAQPGYAVATLWARRKIENLMDELTLGAAPEQIRSAVLETALRHRLVSRYTAFVAVDETPVRSQRAALLRARLANEPPHGSNLSAAGALAMALPQTDAGTVMRTTVGLMLLVLGAILRRRFRDEQ